MSTARPGRPETLDALLRTGQLLTAVLAQSFAHLDTELTVPQWRVMVMVSERGRMTLGEVAGALDVDPSNATRTADRLVASGLLARTENARDRRTKELTLTRAGSRLIKRVMKHRAEVLGHLLDAMDGRAEGQLGRVLGALLEAAADPVGVDEDHTLRWIL